MSFKKEIVSIDFLERIVCDHYRIELGFMFKENRENHIIIIKHQFHYLARKVLRITLKDVAAYKVRRYKHKKAYCHGTIINSEKKVEDMKFMNKPFVETLDLLEAKVIEEIDRRKLVLLSSKIYFRNKIESMMLDFDKCVTKKDFNALLIRNLSASELPKKIREEYETNQGNDSDCSSVHSRYDRQGGINSVPTTGLTETDACPQCGYGLGQEK